MNAARRAVRPALAVVLLVATGCSSTQSVGDNYAQNGRDEIALLYYEGAHLLDRTKPEPAAKLVAAVKVAVRKLSARLDAALEGKRFRKALGLGTRLDEVRLHARRIGLPGFRAVGKDDRVDRALQRWAKVTVRKLDDAAEKEEPETTRLRLCREALAADPDNADLSRRYEVLRRHLLRHVKVRIKERGGGSASLRFRNRMMATLTAAERELFALVPGGSDRADVVLDIAVETVPNDTGWQVVRQGIAKDRVRVRNRFNEVKRDEKNRVVYEKVVARYRVYRRTRSVAIRATVQLSDLRNKSVLYRKALAASPKSTRAYYDWQGDERALRGILWLGVRGKGTNTAPPERLAALTEGALADLVSRHAKTVVEKLEYR